MADILFSDVVPDVQILAPNCPQPLVVGMLRQSARQLCVDSSVYQHHVSFPFVDGTHSYSPTLPAGTEVARYISVSHGVRLLEPATLAEFFSYDEEYPFLQGIPTHYATEEFSSLKFYPVPDADAEAEASCIVFLALCPTNTATGLDQDVFSRYREGIVDGAAARLMAQPDKPWGNPQLSSYYAGRYRAAVKNASGQALRGRVGVEARIKPVWFGV